MARRLGLFLSLLFVVAPAFSDGPRKSDDQPEFYFTRLIIPIFGGVAHVLESLLLEILSAATDSAIP